MAIATFGVNLSRLQFWREGSLISGSSKTGTGSFDRGASGMRYAQHCACLCILFCWRARCPKSPTRSDYFAE